MRLLELDLSSQVSVRTAAKEVLEYQEAHIDILINNAAVSSTPYKLTTEGIEFQFATNHIGPFLFTNLILPKIAATATTSGGGGSDNAKGRIVNVASIAHSFWKDQDGTKLFQDYNCSNGEKYAPMQMYFRSKAANILFTVSLHEKLKDYRGGVTCVCMCPGRVRTQLGREIDDKTKIAMGLMDKDGKPTTGAIKWRSMEQGAATHVYLALGPEVEGHGGEYFQECNSAMHIPMPWAVDSGNAAELWELSEKLVGETFAY